MSILPQLEQDLLDAAARRHAPADPSSRRSEARGGVRSRARRLRLFILSLGGLFATTTIALAASGVIHTGAPVHANARLRPDEGIGVPAPGGSRLLALRASDPEGGLPWGMRIVHTTRGEVCLQIGRVHDGKLGELGIDGAFDDDGRFHPLPSGALPSYAHAKGIYEANANTSCQLAGEAVAGYHVGVDRNASGVLSRGPGDPPSRPSSDLRDLYYGLLGPEAVSVTYRDGSSYRTQAVEPRTGAYLIVEPVAAGQQLGDGGGSLGTYGDLAPSSPEFAVITYRIDGKLCERGPSLPPGTKSHLPHPCKFPHWPSKVRSERDLHIPLHVHVTVRRNIATKATVRFIAPLAVTSAREQYVVEVPDCNLERHVRGSLRAFSFSGASIDRDVRRGATISVTLDSPFANDCGKHAVTIETIFQVANGAGQTLVGKVTVHQPKGTLAVAPGTARRRGVIIRRRVKRRCATAAAKRSRLLCLAHSAQKRSTHAAASPARGK